MLSEHQTIVAVRDQVSSDLGDEVAILSLRNGTYFGLNPVGAFVWRLIQQPKSFGELCRSVLAEYLVEPEQCQEDLQILLQDLKEHQLIEVQG